MAQRKDDQIRQKLFNQLSVWSARSGVADHPYVLELLRALNSEQPLEFWSTIPSRELLPRPVPPEFETKTVQYLTLLRNGLVFLPIALTWASIGQSSLAFSRYIDVNGGQVINFLQFWQNGYGFLSSIWTIGSIATVDVGLMILLIGLTLYIQRQQMLARLALRQFHQTNHEEWVKITLDIDQYLHTWRSVSPTTISSEVRAIISKLNVASSSLEKSAREINTIVKAPLVNRELISLLKKFLKAI